MLKFIKRKTSSEKPTGNASQGNVLLALWVKSLALILLPIIFGFFYLVLLREPNLQQQQVQRVTSTYAVQQAANIELLLRRYQERLAAAAQSPLAQAAVLDSSADDIALVEKAMADYFPGVVSMRVLIIGSMGTAGVESSSEGLRNHIEVDLLRRTA